MARKETEEDRRKKLRDKAIAKALGTPKKEAASGKPEPGLTESEIAEAKSILDEMFSTPAA